MLPLRLARVALEAEGLRLNHRLRRTVISIAMGCVALALLMAALTFLHIGIWCWLRETLPGKYVAAILGGADVLLALVLVFLALRSTPGRVELEALQLRRRAMDDAAASLSFTTLLAQFINQFLAARSRH